MSIYIKGIELPKDEPINIILYPNGKAIKSNAVYYSDTYPFEEITFEQITFEDTEHTPEIYEAFNILAHGRLIEADKLAEKCDDPYWCVWLSDIDDAPTIIPAESEEE
jgi:hypothetical protein